MKEIIIAHRANLNGPSKAENLPFQIEEAIESGFDVEVDVWFQNGWFFLGHDKPETRIFTKDLHNWGDFLWYHCKNLDAMSELGRTRLNYFWHENDRYALTSHGYVWTCEGIGEKEVAKVYNGGKLFGICTDYCI